DPPAYPGDQSHILAHDCNLTGQCHTGHTVPWRHAVPSRPNESHMKLTRWCEFRCDREDESTARTRKARTWDATDAQPPAAPPRAAPRGSLNTTAPRTRATTACWTPTPPTGPRWASRPISTRPRTPRPTRRARPTCTPRRTPRAPRTPVPPPPRPRPPTRTACRSRTPPPLRPAAPPSPTPPTRAPPPTRTPPSSRPHRTPHTARPP